MKANEAATIGRMPLGEIAKVPSRPGKHQWLRKKASTWFYRRFPRLSGSFQYFGTRIYFPKGSLGFIAATEHGIYEAGNLRLLTGLIRPSTWFFDVGANIGLMSAPILKEVADARVLSFEPSPNVTNHLRRTVENSPHGTRWRLVSKAVGDQVGHVEFTLGNQGNSVYDGIKSTQRVPTSRVVQVELTTVDKEWQNLGSPEVSAIKCDVEGAELMVLRGARNCIQANRPPVLIEWNSKNLKAYNCPPEALLEIARELTFDVFSLPNLVQVRTDRDLRLQMLQTESFLLFPN